MSRLTDRLFEIECDLAKYPGTDESDALNRRVILRKALTAWGDERWQEGYLDGSRDVREARTEAVRRARENADNQAKQG